MSDTVAEVILRAQELVDQLERFDFECGECGEGSSYQFERELQQLRDALLTHERLTLAKETST